MILFKGHIDLHGIDYDKIDHFGTNVETKGRTFGSVESESTAGLKYSVLDGDVLNFHFAELIDATNIKIYAEVLKNFGSEFVMIPTIKRAQNINILAKGERYERHIDGNHITSVLFLNDDFNGGELIVDNISISARKGDFVIFEGGKTEHEVLEVLGGSRYTLMYAFDYEDVKENKELEKSLY